MRDSTFGIGISNNAVYVGGHFCKPDGGPGLSEEMTPVSGHNTCTGTELFTGGVWRSHLAALSLTDGTPLTWNPGQNSFTGARDITVTSRGLLVGYDGEKTNDKLVGATAFFDFGPPPTTLVRVKTKGCKRCLVRLTQKRGAAPLWDSGWRKAKRGKTAFSVPRSNTVGLTATIRAPWQKKKSKKVTEVVMRYKGKSVGSKVGAKAAAKAKKASSCWAGTSASSKKFKVMVRHVVGKKRAARAWVKKTQSFRKPMKKARQGVLAVKKPTVCS